MVLLLFFMIRKGAHMYSDRQTELSVFLEQLRQLAEEKTEERVIIHAVTKEDGEKIFEIIIGENPLFAPVICVKASGTGYGKSGLDDILQGLWTVYGRYKKLDRKGFFHHVKSRQKCEGETKEKHCCMSCS